MKKIALFFLSLLVSFSLMLQLPASVSPSFHHAYYAYAAKTGKAKAGKDSGIIATIISSAVNGATRELINQSISALLGLIPGPRDHKYVIQVVNGTDYPLKLVDSFSKTSSSWPLKDKAIIPAKSENSNIINSAYGVVTNDEFDITAVYQLDGKPTKEFYILSIYRKAGRIGGPFGLKSDKRIAVDAVDSTDAVQKYKEYYLNNKGKEPDWVGRPNNEALLKSPGILLGGERLKDKQFLPGGTQNTVSAAVWNFVVSPPLPGV